MQRFAWMQRLVLFDIDGTLTRTQNGFVPFNEAILAAFGFPGDIRAVVPDGNTDPSIVEEICAKAEIETRFGDEDWQRFTIHLHDIDVKSFIAEEAALLGHIKVDGRDTPARNRKDDLFGTRLRLDRGRRHQKPEHERKAKPHDVLSHSALSTHRFGDAPISFNPSRTRAEVEDRIDRHALLFPRSIKPWTEA